MTQQSCLILGIACVLAATGAVLACSSDDDDGEADTAGSAGTIGQGSGNGGQSHGGSESGSGGAQSGSGGTQSGSGGINSGVGGYDNGSGGVSTCDNADTNTAAFVEANQTCSTAADCVEVSAGCYSQQQDCCVVYLNRDYDQSAWSALTDQLDSCQGPCGCCAAIPAPPGCSAGRCGPDRG